MGQREQCGTEPGEGLEGGSGTAGGGRGSEVESMIRPGPGASERETVGLGKGT